VEERDGEEEDVLLRRVEHLRDLAGVLGHVHVGEHRPLGVAGRARGVEDEHAIVRVKGIPAARDLGLGGAVPAAGEDIGVRSQPGGLSAHGDRLPQKGEVRPDLGEHRCVVDPEEPLGHEHRLRLRVPEDVGHFVGLVAGVHGHDHGPCLGDRKIGRDPLRDVRHPDPDLIAGLDPQRHQPGGEAVHLPGEVTVGDRPSLVEQGRPSGEPVGGLVEHLG